MNRLAQIGVPLAAALSFSGERAAPVVAHPIAPIAAAGVMPMPGAKPNAPPVLRPVVVPDGSTEAGSSKAENISTRSVIGWTLGVLALVGATTVLLDRYISDGL